MSAARGRPRFRIITAISPTGPPSAVRPRRTGVISTWCFRDIRALEENGDEIGKLAFGFTDSFWHSGAGRNGVRGRLSESGAGAGRDEWPGGATHPAVDRRSARPQIVAGPQAALRLHAGPQRYRGD